MSNQYKGKEASFCMQAQLFKLKVNLGFSNLGIYTKKNPKWIQNHKHKQIDANTKEDKQKAETG